LFHFWAKNKKKFSADELCWALADPEPAAAWQEAGRALLVTRTGLFVVAILRRNLARPPGMAGNAVAAALAPHSR